MAKSLPPPKTGPKVGPPYVALDRSPAMVSLYCWFNSFFSEKRNAWDEEIKPVGKTDDGQNYTLLDPIDL